MLLEGLHIPLTTPFRRNGSLDSQALAANVLRYSMTPAAGLIILGPTAEPTLLSDDETHEVLRTAAQAAAPEKVLIAGLARDSVRAALQLAEFAAEQRYDAIIVGAPGILSTTRTLELLTFFRAVADRSPLPLVLLSTPTRPVPVPAAAELAAHRNIIGLIATHAHSVDAVLAAAPGSAREVTVTHVFAPVTARMQRAATASLISPASLSTALVESAPPGPTLRTRTRSVGFQVIAGHESTLIDALGAGAVGIAPAFAAAAPQACYEVFAAWKDQDGPLVAEKQQRITGAAELVNALGPGGLKFAADLNGYAAGLPRLPYLPASREQKAALELLMKPLHN